MTEATTALDPFTPDATRDPHPVYKRLREDAPVHYHPSLDAWTVARHADVQAVMKDAKTFSSTLGYAQMSRLTPDSETPPGMMSMGDAGRMVITADPPDHTKLRRLVSAPFGPREVAPMEPRLRALCEELVDEMLAADEPDLIGHVGWPLPVIVIAEVLGIPPERRDDFKRWSNDMVGGLSGDFDFASRAQSAFEMFEFFSAAIAERQTSPGDDAISFLISKASVFEGEDQLLPQELVGFCILLLIAGNETTTNLVGNGVHAFFDHPGEWQRLLDDPSLMPSAVEELLRFDGPVKTIMRGTREEVEVAGVTIPAGARVLPLFSSANRDERVWADADVLRVDRNPQEHVAFGYGIHHCLGAPLARLEARVLFETLARRGITLEPAGEAVPVLGPILRGFTSVPVRVA
jgi:cytochrome P450